MSNDAITAYPLCWPVGWPRCQSPQYSNFKTGLVKARDGLARELDLLGARGVVISSNAVPLRSGEIAGRQPRLDDTGVAAYFTLGGEPRCIPCDKWIYREDNVHAIALTVGALRGLERWGAKEIVSAAFQGFQALPAGEDAAWWRVLGVAPDASEVEVEAAYRRLVKTAHPDAGGDAARFRAITEAYRRAKARRAA